MFDFDRFDALVKSKGLAKSFIANKIGKNPAIFRDWAKGKSKPSGEYLKVVSECLDCSVDYLMGNTDTPAHKKSAPAVSTAEAILMYARDRLGREPTPEDIATIHSAVDIAIQHLGNKGK